MARIQIFEQLCCPPGDACCATTSAGEQLAGFLRARPGPRHDIEVTNIDDRLDADGLPVELAERLRGGDRTCLPALAVDGQLVHVGPLPNWLQVLSLVEHATATRRTGAVGRR